MTEPFSHEAFNFTKVKQSEVLAKYYVDHGRVIFVDKDAEQDPKREGALYTILLNGMCLCLRIPVVSPICNNHHLIVPNVSSCYPQIWRYELTEDLLAMCANSGRDDYVLFFNSLGGFSSVNHLHVSVLLLLYV